MERVLESHVCSSTLERSIVQIEVSGNGLGQETKRESPPCARFVGGGQCENPPRAHAVRGRFRWVRG